MNIMLQSFLALCFCLSTFVLPIEVAPNSPCSAQCVDSKNADPANPASSTTQTWNLHCQDWELSGTSSSSDGQKWESCLSCESKSRYNDPTTSESDVMWFLFNIRFTLDWCIFGYQNNNPNGTLAMSKCSNVCSGPGTGMQTALTTLLHTNTSTQYNYCDEGDAAFSDNVDDCIQCLTTVPSSTTLANYLRALGQACAQRPLPGSKAINLNFPLFQNESITSNSSTAGDPSHTVPSTLYNRRLVTGLAVGLGCTFLCALVFGTLFFLHKRRVARSTRNYNKANGNDDNRKGSYAESGTSWFSHPVPAPSYVNLMGGPRGVPPPLYPNQYSPPPPARVYYEAMSKEISEPQGSRIPVQHVLPPDYLSPVEAGGVVAEAERKGLDTGSRNGNWI